MTVNPRPILAPDSQPWARSVDRRLESLDRSAAQNAQDVSNAITQLSSSVQLLSQQVLSLPLPTGYYQRSDGFGLAAPVYIQRSITVPAGKTRVVFTAVANVSALDVTSGGLAVAYALIEVNGSGFIWSSPLVPAAKDTGASQVNNIISPVLGFEQGGLVPGSNFLVSLNISASNGAAFPARAQNFGTLAINATFFN